MPIKYNEKKVKNTTLVFDKGVFLDKYEKCHTYDCFIPGKVDKKESDFVEKGNELKVIKTRFGNFGLGICYDIRFADFSMALRKKGAEVLFFPSIFTLHTGKLHFQKTGIARALDT